VFVNELHMYVGEYVIIVLMSGHSE